MVSIKRGKDNNMAKRNTKVPKYVTILHRKLKYEQHKHSPSRTWVLQKNRFACSISDAVFSNIDSVIFN